MIPLSITQVGDFATQELPKLRQQLNIIRKQVTSGAGVFGHANGSVVNAVVDPTAWDIQLIGQLWDGEIARHATGMGLARAAHDAMVQTDRLYGAWEHAVVPGRAMATRAEPGGDFVVAAAFACESQQVFLHLLSVRQSREAADGDRHVGLRHCAAAPYQTHMNPVGHGAMQHDLFDERPQQ